MSRVADTLFTLVELLDEMSIPYSVMGGLAVRSHGVPRPTYDVDVNLVIDRSRLSELFESLREIGYVIPEPYESGWVDEVNGLRVLKLRRYLQGESLDVDLFLVETTFQREAMERRLKIDAEGRRVWVVSPEDLILFKLLASRPRDLSDVSDVLFMQGPLDLEYMRKWARQLAILDELEKAISEQHTNYGDEK